MKDINTNLPLFITGMGCGILTTYTQIANIAGIQGLLVYTIAGALPIFLFSFMGPLIRRRCPDGFVLTEWCYHRFGPVATLYLSAFTVLTIFLFMVGELTAVGSAINALTGLDPTPAIVVEAIVTTIYTAFGGFKVSFITDSFQSAFVIVIMIIGIIGYATQIHIDIDLKNETYAELTGSNRLGWQLFYILNIAIITNDCFMSGFWLRTFAAKTDKDLKIGTGIAAILVLIVCTLVGLPGILAVWTGDITVGDDMGYNAFFILVAKMDKWIIGVILIFSITLSTCTFDSLQSACTSSISNDLFRNKFPMIYSRILVVLIMIPSLVVAIKASANVLQIYFIADLVSSSIIPIMFLGLSKHFYFLRGLDVMVGGLGALLAVFIFGCIYYGNARDGGLLLIMSNGVYNAEDWGPFGAFLIAPGFGIILGFLSAGVRLSIQKFICKRKGIPFTGLDRIHSRAFGIFDTEEFADLDQTDSSEEAIDSCDDVETAKSIDKVDATMSVREIIAEFKWADLLHLFV